MSKGACPGLCPKIVGCMSKGIYSRGMSESMSRGYVRGICPSGECPMSISWGMSKELFPREYIQRCKSKKVSPRGHVLGLCPKIVGGMSKRIYPRKYVREYV